MSVGEGLRKLPRDISRQTPTSLVRRLTFASLDCVMRQPNAVVLKMNPFVRDPAEYSSLERNSRRTLTESLTACTAIHNVYLRQCSFKRVDDVTGTTAPVTSCINIPARAHRTWACNGPRRWRTLFFCTYSAFRVERRRPLLLGKNKFNVYSATGGHCSFCFRWSCWELFLSCLPAFENASFIAMYVFLFCLRNLTTYVPCSIVNW